MTYRTLLKSSSLAITAACTLLLASGCGGGEEENNEPVRTTRRAPAPETSAPPEPAASWFCLEPGTRLEKALARGAQVRPDASQDGLYDPSHEAAGPPHPAARQGRLS